MTQSPEQPADSNPVKDIKPLTRRVALTEVGSELSLTLTLSERQCEKLAEILDLPSLTSFEATADITPRAKRRFHMKALIRADFTQISSVSLEPIPLKMDESFETIFWPEQQNTTENAEELELDYEEDMVEFYENEKLEIGQVIYEQFVVALDQFPRGKGEVFEWHDPTDDDSENENPFAILKNLKN